VEFFEVVERRRSMRRFKRVKIPEEDVRRIMEAGRPRRQTPRCIFGPRCASWTRARRLRWPG